MSAGNEVWIYGERLDLDEGSSSLLPSFQANDRSRPDTIQSDYSPEFDVPGTARNHRLLRHAAASQPAAGGAYTRVPAVLTSGGVETLPLALLYIKGYREGRYQLQLFGGNRRLVEVLGDKTLADLDLNRFNHSWLPATVLTGLPYSWWEQHGWGYEVYDRGKPIDFENLDPYTCYPSVAAWLVWQQIITDAGFTADSLLGEELFAALNLPSANPYVFPQAFRDARALQAGFEYNPAPASDSLSDRRKVGIGHESEFAPERLSLSFTSESPYKAPTAGTAYDGTTLTVDTLGYYTITPTVPVRYGCDGVWPGQVSCKVMIYINGQPAYQNGQQIGFDEHRITDNSETTGGGGYMTRVFSPKLERHLLDPTDRVELFWQGDEWETFGTGPTDPYWQIGPVRDTRSVNLADGRALLVGAEFKFELLEEFPEGGLIKLQDWLPQIKQLQYVKSIMELLGLTIQVDQYRPHMHLAPGNRLLENIPLAKDWSNKLDLFARPGRLPERDLSYRFGDYAQRNILEWKEDENVKPGYGNGLLLIADDTLGIETTIATLAFAATEESPRVPGLLRILNYKVENFTANPIQYNAVTAEPRLTLRRESPAIMGRLITIPATANTPAQTQLFATTASYFAGVGPSLMLNQTVLERYYSDLRAMLDQSRYLVERFRLRAQDITELDFSIPVWVSAFQDYFCVSKIEEFDARRITTVHLVRLNATHLPPPMVPDAGKEFWQSEYYSGEFY